jgi:photosystem II stability/assembly factor-like uncharacterized protein
MFIIIKDYGNKMKKVLKATSVLLFLFIQNVLGQGWQWVETGFPVHIFDMSFSPGQSDIGFAVGSTLPFGGDGIVLKTIDGGSNWTKISADTLPGLKAVCFTSINVGFAAGYQNFLMKTTDGGSSWESLVIDSKLWYFNNIEFWDENNGVIVSYPSSVYRTSDAGITWGPTFGLKHNVEDICYADANILYLVGSDERVYKSTNNGFFWIEVDSGAALKSFYGIDFYNTDFGIVSGEDGKMKYTTDGGTSWATSNTGGNGLMHGVHIFNAQTAYAVGTTEQVFKSTNSGINWYSNFSGTDNTELYKIKFTENQVGLICGSDGKFLKNNDYSVPVELTNFTANADGNEVQISWTTQTELNNSGFEIYRLTHGTDWQKISFVPGSGSSTEPKDYFYIDKDVKNGNYFYQLKQIDYNGRYEFSDVISVEVSTPMEYSLEQNFPNPFNPATAIKFELPETAEVTLTIYNTLGQKVDEIVNTTLEAGRYTYKWHAEDFPDGIYFFELCANNFKSARKMILLK